ncbi:glycoside hydrolase/phage tail family protein [Aliisedimentitalea scapharcae]|uniref:Glycoside hydrolase/phage tail family protein n=1 Tax=Aliisedimentitalea scapharcae TaxID=1524259 RepID=A0ABZ2XXD9_9RHOB
MTTIVLSAAGAAIGGAAGGAVAGLSSVAVGRAAGAILGRVIDQRLLGAGAESVATGKVERFRLTHAAEGAPISQVFGRMRVGGQVIWATDFQESSTTTGGGKGAPSTPRTTTYSYTVSLAIAVCEGEVTSIGRVWADGEEVARDDLNMRVYLGAEDQLPDPTMEAVEGVGQVPAYRGTAYVVMEDLSLEAFGNRVPQFSFEVVRAEQPEAQDFDTDLGQIIRGVALMPGTGEYTLASEPVFYSDGPASKWGANTNSPSGKTDLETSLQHLDEELPASDAASLVVSWFGNDLRCGACQVVPKMEKRSVEGINMPWRVGGLTRATADEMRVENGRPIYGGTPSDDAVVQAIRHMADAGRRVMFYPFILMDQPVDNGLADPWTGNDHQPHLPWRGRITLSTAPGQDGTPDQTAGADAEVAAFFGAATAADFVIGDGVVSYTGPDEWGMRRFILHNAALCAAAGGVDSFCIGSEMRGLTQIRGASGFPAVQALIALAAEVRAILGPDTKIGYAADWSEYFGYQPTKEPGDRYFHLDPLWADANIDFVGIDNYMPVSDWRDAPDHIDKAAGWNSIYDLGYLRSNVEGGEGYDWYYHSPEAEAAQIRTPIADLAHGEDWIWRYKDMRGWWSNPHYERIGGLRQAAPTDWVPQSKPIWFTELGCASVDKGTNQPNKFLDPKSSESSLPKFSTGHRDDLIQRQYLKAVLGYWGEETNNPVSEVYAEPMIDMQNAFVWAWDVRPFPVFPNNRYLWSDGTNYARGHWLNGKVGARTLASVVKEICVRSGVSNIDTSGLYGVVRGYVIDQVSDARAALQPLMLRYGFDAIERDGVLRFVMRDGLDAAVIDLSQLAETDETDAVVDHAREADAELVGRVRLQFLQSGADHEVLAEEVVLPEHATHAVSSSELPLSMTRAEARHVVERWLAESRVSRDTVRFALPPSRIALGAGDVVKLPVGEGKDALFRIDRVEQSGLQLIEAVRIEPEVYTPSEQPEDLPSAKAFVAPTPVLPFFMDLPLMTGDEVPHAPHVAVTATPWPGTVALYGSGSDDNYVLDEIIAARSIIGATESPLAWARSGVWDEGVAVQVKLFNGALESRYKAAVLNGANLAAIGDGTSGNWELFQFRTADLIAPDTYLLSGRLRGQLGSDGLMPDAWPQGSSFVLLDRTQVQIDLTSAQRRISRHYRIGPARRPYSDPSYVHLTEAFDGNGLRPYAPSHLRAVSQPSGDLVLSWVRRTRIDGDAWDNAEVPLGEESEHYRVRVLEGNSVLREVEVTTPAWIYTDAQQAADGASAAIDIEVAQVSVRYGPGLPRRITVGAS